MKERTLKTKLLTVLLTLCLALSIVPITAFADSGSYAVKFYPGDYGTMTKNDQIPFVYYNIDDDVNKPFYYKLHVSETDTFGFVGSIMDTLLPHSGYEFAYWTADATVYQVGSGTAIPAGTALSSDQLQNKITVKSDVTFTAHFKQISEYPDDSVITTATIENVKFDYQLGDAPQATAWVAIDDMDKYEIDYECWQQFKGNEPVAAWYSDNGAHGSLPTITEFESGEKYVYFLMLKPKDGYSFSSETAVTVNAESAKSSLSREFLYVPAVKTITMPTIKVIDVVEINDATVSFKDGDKPVFTGDVPDDVYYVLRAAWWELNSTTGLISTEPEFGSGIYENKITTFEAGKTYHYGVYVVAYGDVGNVRYVFGPDTKLKINGEFVNYKRYEGDMSDGSDGTMWVLTDLTMTPEAGGTAPSEKYTVTYTDGVDGEEIFKDQTYTVEAGKATPAFNGTPARDGYKFTGWTPAVADTVTRNATYTAQWEKLTPAETFTVTYTDGVDNEEIFKDQTYTVESGKATPAFNGTPTRKGYTFAGWKPAVAATVTSNATYEATWKSDSATTTPSDNKPSTGETTSPKTGDTSNIVLWAALLFVSCGALAGTLVIDKKKKAMK
ncbi:MAG: InlB B-repeat-containing protein [Eubacteriales bacterium]|nr:InlB B-repeat-containing protein [Eubacteriales bacterium]